jgi:hypothetical protein
MAPESIATTWEATEWATRGTMSGEGRIATVTPPLSSTGPV